MEKITPLRLGFYGEIPSPLHRLHVERAARACWTKERWWHRHRLPKGLVRREATGPWESA